MSRKISAEKFFKENGLFDLLMHEEGEMDKSYKTENQQYVIKCKKCGEEIRLKGNSKFQCRRCRREVVREGDNLIIREPSGADIARAEKAMKRDPIVLVQSIEDDASSDDEEEEEPKNKLPDTDTTVAFLKSLSGKISGGRIVNTKVKEDEDITQEEEKQAPRRRTRRDASEESLSEESILPTSKSRSKKVPEPKEVPVEAKDDCPQVKEVSMKIVELKPGQTYFSKELGIMFVGVA